MLKVIRAVYHMDAFIDDADSDSDLDDEDSDGPSEPECFTPPSDDERDPGDDDDDEGGDEPKDGADKKRRKTDDVAGSAACKDDSSAGGDAAGDGPSISKLRNSVACRRMREYLAIALQRHAFITVDVADETESEFVLSVYQVLDRERRAIQVKLFNGFQETETLYSLVVQPYEILWNRSRHKTLPGLLDVFRVREPTSIDALALIGVMPTARQRIKQWTCQTSDVVGCITLVSPCDLEVQIPLYNSTVPLLTLHDALANKGFEQAAHKVVHSLKGGSRKFDSRSESKWYLRCCLIQQSLFTQGIKFFNSLQPDSFYHILARSPGKALAKQTNDVYGKVLAALGDELGVVLQAALTGIDAKPRYPRRVNDSDSEIGGGANSDGSVDRPPQRRRRQVQVRARVHLIPMSTPPLAATATRRKTSTPRSCLVRLCSVGSTSLMGLRLFSVFT